MVIMSLVSFLFCTGRLKDTCDYTFFLSLFLFNCAHFCLLLQDLMLPIVSNGISHPAPPVMENKKGIIDSNYETTIKVPKKTP